MLEDMQIGKIASRWQYVRNIEKTPESESQSDHMTQTVTALAETVTINVMMSACLSVHLSLYNSRRFGSAASAFRQVNKTTSNKSHGTKTINWPANIDVILQPR